MSESDGEKLGLEEAMTDDVQQHVVFELVATVAGGRVLSVDGRWGPSVKGGEAAVRSLNTMRAMLDDAAFTAQMVMTAEQQAQERAAQEPMPNADADTSGEGDASE